MNKAMKSRFGGFPSRFCLHVCTRGDFRRDADKGIDFQAHKASQGMIERCHYLSRSMTLTLSQDLDRTDRKYQMNVDAIRGYFVVVRPIGETILAD
jgi:hypothetical protein